MKELRGWHGSISDYLVYFIELSGLDFDAIERIYDAPEQMCHNCTKLLTSYREALCHAGYADLVNETDEYYINKYPWSVASWDDPKYGKRVQNFDTEGLMPCDEC